MSSIRTSIELVDKFSPVLKSVMRAVDSTLKAMERLDKQSNEGKMSKAYEQAEKDIKRANNAIIKLKNETDKAGHAADDAEKKYSRFGNTVSGIGSKFSGINSGVSMFLQGLASAVYLGQQLSGVVDGIMSKADEHISKEARIGLFNTSQYSNRDLYHEVFNSASDSRSSFVDTADLVSKLLIADIFQGEGAPQAAIGTASIINKALTAGGGTREENQRALRQLSQALSSGILQGDELRSIREQTPYFAQMLASGLQHVSPEFADVGIGDLKRLGAEGKLTSDVVVKAMWAMQDEIDKQFNKMPKTFGQATVALQNHWQRFLWLLSDAEGPLGRINNKLWELVDYLGSAQGIELLEDIAFGIDIASYALTGFMDLVKEVILFLQENENLTKSIFIGIGLAALAAGTLMMIGWIQAIWPLLLIIGIVYVAIGVLDSMGITSQRVLSNMGAWIFWVGAIIWDVLIWALRFVIAILAIVAISFISLGTVASIAILGIAQVFMFVLAVIVSGIKLVETLFDIAMILIEGGWWGLGYAVVSVFKMIWDAATSVLSWFAKGWDKVFGSDLAGDLKQWTDAMDETVDKFKAKSQIEGKIEGVWGNYDKSMNEIWSEDSKFNLIDNMGDTISDAQNLGKGVMSLYNMGDNKLNDALVNPNTAYNNGFNFGNDLSTILSGGNYLKIPNNSIMDRFNLNNVGIQDAIIKGGNLDSVGSIGSDIEIKDEDLELIRDMAARDYLLQLQSITPVVNAQFGDVRETADVEQIMEKLEDMIIEQTSTSLVSN